MKELKGIDENTVIHCTTEQEMEAIEALYKSKTGVSVYWKRLKERNCIWPAQGETISIEYATYKDNQLKVLTAAEFIRLNTHPELQVTFENGNYNGFTIPAKWCVRRTPENAEVLNAWAKHKCGIEYFDTKGYTYSDGQCFSTEIGAGEAWTKITFEQWQTIPEIAEWINKDGYFVWREWQNKQRKIEKFTTYDEKQRVIATSDTHPILGKVEEREIIGYKLPYDLNWGCKKGKIVKVSDISHSGNRYAIYADNGENGKMWIPTEWVETWEPVYREEPKFKVGDWIKDSISGLIIQVMGVNNASGRYDAGPKCVYFRQAILATPEEIEAARPREIWEKYPTWDSLELESNVITDDVNQETHDVVWSLIQLKDLEKAWNEGKIGNWTIWFNKQEDCFEVIDLNFWVAQINFASEKLAQKSLELHSDLWRKYWMV